MNPLLLMRVNNPLFVIQSAIKFTKQIPQNKLEVELDTPLIKG